MSELMNIAVAANALAILLTGWSLARLWDLLWPTYRAEPTRPLWCVEEEQ